MKESRFVWGIQLLCLLLFLTGCSEILDEIPGDLRLPAILWEEEESFGVEEALGDEQENLSSEHESLKDKLTADSRKQESKDEKLPTSQVQKQKEISLEDLEQPSVNGCFLMEEAGDYAYRNLNKNQQIWYRDIETLLGSMEDTVMLSKAGIDAGMDVEDIDEIFQCVLIDHPELFFIEGYTYTRSARGDELVSVEFAGNYSCTKEEAVEKKIQMEDEIHRFLSDISMDASDYEKVKYVYEKVISDTDYNLEAPDNQNIYSVFMGHESVCQGYAKACQFLLNKLGLECVLVQGTVDNGEGHAWNLVNVDGSYYYIDSTWGDASYQSDENSEVGEYFPQINYDYLCVTTKELLRTHTIDNYVTMPECVDTKSNYYIMEGAFFTEYDEIQLGRLFEKALKDGKTDVTIKCADILCYEEMTKRLIENQEIFDYMEDSRGSVSYANNDIQMSMTFWMTNE